MTYACNSFASPALIWFGPFQLNYGRPSKFLLEIETNPQEDTFVSFKEYYNLLRYVLHTFGKTLQDYRLQQRDMINKDRPMTQEI